MDVEGQRSCGPALAVGESPGALRRDSVVPQWWCPAENDLAGSRGWGTGLGSKPCARAGAGQRWHRLPEIEEWGFCAAYQDGGSRTGCEGSCHSPPGRWLQSAPCHGEDFGRGAPPWLAGDTGLTTLHGWAGISYAPTHEHEGR